MRDMNRKLVDPVHFFDANGDSVLNLKHLRQRNEELERQNEKLKSLIRRLRRRLEFTEEQVGEQQ